MKMMSVSTLVLCLFLSPVTFAKSKGAKAKKTEMMRLCKEENPDATNKLLKKCVRDKMKVSKR
jgi:hypothetical protein